MSFGKAHPNDGTPRRNSESSKSLTMNNPLRSAENIGPTFRRPSVNGACLGSEEPRVGSSYIQQGFSISLISHCVSSLNHSPTRILIMSESTLFTEAAVPEAPPDSHYGLRAQYQADDHPDKVNLVIGAYKDDEGQPWILPVVKRVCPDDLGLGVLVSHFTYIGLRLREYIMKTLVKIMNICPLLAIRASVKLQPRSSSVPRQQEMLRESEYPFLGQCVASY